MAYDYFFTDDVGDVGVAVDACAVLDVGSAAYRDGGDVAANYGVEPEAAMFADGEIAGEDGIAGFKIVACGLGEEGHGGYYIVRYGYGIARNEIVDRADCSVFGAVHSASFCGVFAIAAFFRRNWCACDVLGAAARARFSLHRIKLRTLRICGDGIADICLLGMRVGSARSWNQ